MGVSGPREQAVHLRRQDGLVLRSLRPHRRKTASKAKRRLADSSRPADRHSESFTALRPPRACRSKSGCIGQCRAALLATGRETSGWRFFRRRPHGRNCGGVHAGSAGSRTVQRPALRCPYSPARKRRSGFPIRRLEKRTSPCLPRCSSFLPLRALRSFPGATQIRATAFSNRKLRVRHCLIGVALPARGTTAKKPMLNFHLLHSTLDHKQRNPPFARILNRLHLLLMSSRVRRKDGCLPRSWVSQPRRTSAPCVSILSATIKTRLSAILSFNFGAMSRNTSWAKSGCRSFPQQVGHNYRPLFLLWLRLNNACFGLNPRGWHAAAMGLHLLCTLLVYLLFRRMTQKSAFAAMRFDLRRPSHSRRSRGVGFRCHRVSACGVSSSCISMLFEVSGREFRHLVGYFLHSLLGLAVFSKESGVVFPALIFSYAWIYGPPRGVGDEASSAVSAPIPPQPFAMRFLRAFAVTLPYWPGSPSFICLREFWSCTIWVARPSI